jgi:hypothetical protein
MAGRKHKGDRVLLASRPHRVVRDIITERASALGVPMSQYVADVLAVHVGRGDLVVAGTSRPAVQQDELPLG